MMISGHGGNIRELAKLAGRKPGEVIDFSANINPLGLPAWVSSVIKSAIDDIVHYPDPDCSSLVDLLSERYGVRREEIIVGNGSTEILYLIPQVLSVRRAFIPVPSYSDYLRAATLAKLMIEKLLLREEEGFQPNMEVISSYVKQGDIVFLGQPNNPTGMLYDASRLRELAIMHPSAFFLVDEAFADFVEDMDSMANKRPSNVVVLLSLTKNFAIPGLRLGCAIADRELVNHFKEMQPPWTVNSFAQAVGEAALRDIDYIERSRSYVSAQRAMLAENLRSMGCLTVYPGKANFLLVRIDKPGIDALSIASRMLADGIAIRLCQNFDGLDARFFRIAVRTEKENAKLLESLWGILRQVL